jgi:hypothetical protein
MKPFVIVHRATAEKELQYYRYTRQNAIFASQENALITTALFERWARSVFFPTIQHRRQKCGYFGKAIPLMGGLGSRHSQQFLDECTAQDIKPIFLIPHSSDQTQP